MGKYFGTDGIRGKYGEMITEELAFLTGSAVGRYFDGDCVVGRDSRVSGEALQEAFIQGFISSGGNALAAGIVPTPAVSLLTKTMGCSCGVMISASHNPPEYNGIKVFGKEGIKLSQQQEESIEYYIDNRAESYLGGGHRYQLRFAASQYIDKLCALGSRLDGVTVWLDSGFGAAGAIAARVFTRLGARVISLNDSLDGSKINVECGALHIDRLNGIMGKVNARYLGGDKAVMSKADLLLNKTTAIDKEVLSKSKLDKASLGFAFDGDADRMTMVYNGKVLCGDSVLYSLSKSRNLKDNVVVGTVMSNLALERRLRQDGKKLLRTKVGDKHILDLMLRRDYSLGGEQSGHYIFYPECATGDGILAALKMSECMLRQEICSLELVPQKTVSLVSGAEVMFDNRLKKLVSKAERSLGRVIVRMSGTEPKLRVMAEDEDPEKIQQILDEFSNLILSINQEKSARRTKNLSKGERE